MFYLDNSIIADMMDTIAKKKIINSYTWICSLILRQDIVSSRSIMRRRRISSSSQQHDMLVLVSSVLLLVFLLLLVPLGRKPGGSLRE